MDTEYNEHIGVRKAIETLKRIAQPQQASAYIIEINGVLWLFKDGEKLHEATTDEVTQYKSKC